VIPYFFGISHVDLHGVGSSFGFNPITIHVLGGEDGCENDADTDARPGGDFFVGKIFDLVGHLRLFGPELLQSHNAAKIFGLGGFHAFFAKGLLFFGAILNRRFVILDGLFELDLVFLDCLLCLLNVHVVSPFCGLVKQAVNSFYHSDINIYSNNKLNGLKLYCFSENIN
jgi:hypothetical protein